VAETVRFERGTQIWYPRMEDLLNLGGQTLHRWSLRLMPNISYAGCPGLSWMVSAQFTVKMCNAAWNREKITKNPYFVGLRSFKAIDVGTPRKLASSACYDQQQVCVYLQPFLC